MSTDVNPYRSPFEYASDEASEHGVWSHGECLLVDRRSHSFPNRCLICNAPAAGKSFGVRLSWLPDSARGIAAAFHVAGPLAFILVMILFTHWARLKVPFCSHHVWQRRRAILLGWFSFPIALVLMGVCVERRFNHDWFIVLLGLAGVAGSVYGYLTFAGPKAVRIDRRFVLMKRIAPGFLNNVPCAPVGDSI